MRFKCQITCQEPFQEQFECERIKMNLEEKVNPRFQGTLQSDILFWCMSIKPTELKALGWRLGTPNTLPTCFAFSGKTAQEERDTYSPCPQYDISIQGIHQVMSRCHLKLMWTCNPGILVQYLWVKFACERYGCVSWEGGSIVSDFNYKGYIWDNTKSTTSRARIYIWKLRLVFHFSF